MQRTQILLILGFLFGLGCGGHDGIVDPEGPVGKITLSFPHAPAEVARVVGTLSRQGYSGLTLSLVVVDSTQGASGSFTAVPVGTWHLKVEALDALDVVRFRGETDVHVVGGQTSNVDLELLPTSGSINIRVRWGTRNCILEELPLAGTADAPVLTYAALACQENFINVLATAVDPQGDADLLQVVQRIRVFEEPDCASNSREVTDDFVGSGVEESFGVVFEQGMDPAVFARICASRTWPIEVELSDASGNTTTGRVLATVIH